MSTDKRCSKTFGPVGRSKNGTGLFKCKLHYCIKDKLNKKKTPVSLIDLS